MFKVKLVMSTGINSSRCHMYLVEATNSRYQDTVVELEHVVADLLKQWRIVRLGITLRW
jgi:hypothetical protein